MSENVTEITQDTFDAEVRQSQVPVLVDFWAPWCGPCRALAPVLDQVAGELGGKVKIVKVNVDENPQIAQEFNIMAIPTMIIFAGGEMKEQIQGVRQKNDLKETLEKHAEAVA